MTICLGNTLYTRARLLHTLSTIPIPKLQKNIYTAYMTRPGVTYAKAVNLQQQLQPDPAIRLYPIKLNHLTHTKNMLHQMHK
ncbi:hypothetical protein K0M31_016103 [Melipona bicolor]|uniref:Uncharacterized protein n=1 Tax=Melipona bicolor TaxID=60889 RepID=A0AA40G6J7_9HYME|nr:hypothetical protein K0M31_016103 [Melipona bicolor]